MPPDEQLAKPPLYSICLPPPPRCHSPLPGHRVSLVRTISLLSMADLLSFVPVSSRPIAAPYTAMSDSFEWRRERPTPIRDTGSDTPYVASSLYPPDVFWPPPLPSTATTSPPTTTVAAAATHKKKMDYPCEW